MDLTFLDRAMPGAEAAAEGNGGRAWGWGSWTVPADIRLDRDAEMLSWTFAGDPGQRVSPTPGLLKHFLRLKDMDDAGILRFAQRWGPLHLCPAHPHKSVYHRHTDSEAWRRGDLEAMCRALVLDGRSIESLAAWRQLSWEAGLILRAGERARHGESQFSSWHEWIAELVGVPRDTPLSTSLTTLFRPELVRPDEDPAATRSAAEQEVATRIAQRRPNGESLQEFAARTMELAAQRGFTLPDPEIDDRSIARSRETRRKAIAADPSVMTARKAAEETVLRSLDHSVAVAWRVHGWIRDGGGYNVEPVWPAGTPQWRTGVESLYAALGVGLWNALRDSVGFGVCRGCGRVFDRTRSDKQFCDRPECETAKATEAQSRWRKRSKAGSARPYVRRAPEE